ncbi:MAG: hypothetical protein QM767_24640 [Anaeromyxobacter sp.]
MIRRRAARAAALSLVLAAPWGAGAEQRRPCSAPAIFPGAYVQSLVLPYRYTGQPDPELDRAGHQISAPIHFEVLTSLLKYGRVAGTQLVAPPGERCDPAEVIARVTRTLPRDHGLVVVWGRLYQEGEQYYVQTFVRFFRGGEHGPARESISVPIRAGDRTLTLLGTLPTDTVAFPPRVISREDVRAVNQAFTHAMVLRERPDPDAPGQPLTFSAEHAFPYAVTEARGGWLRLEPMESGPAGWVQASGASLGARSLRRWLPELGFVEGAAAFLRLRGEEPAPEGTRAWMVAALERFPGDADEAPEAAGVARALRGFAAWTAPRQGEGRGEAARMFAEARARLPDHAAARNLAGVTAPFRDAPGGQEAPRLGAPAVEALHRELLGALALDPRDPAVLQNLALLYEALATDPAAGNALPRAEAARRLERVRARQADLR